jgi:peptide subunit release factor 1 (eRF1)
VIYCGEVITSEGKQRKLNIDFEPFKPINTSLYLLVPLAHLGTDKTDLR